MSKRNHQVMTGAVVAAVLTIGAAAGGGQSAGGQLSPLANGPGAWFAGTVEGCSIVAFDRALDAYGALIAELRQF